MCFPTTKIGGGGGHTRHGSGPDEAKSQKSLGQVEENAKRSKQKHGRNELTQTSKTHNISSNTL